MRFHALIEALPVVAEPRCRGLLQRAVNPGIGGRYVVGYRSAGPSTWGDVSRRDDRFGNLHGWPGLLNNRRLTIEDRLRGHGPGGGRRGNLDRGGNHKDGLAARALDLAAGELITRPELLATCAGKSDGHAFAS